MKWPGLLFAFPLLVLAAEKPQFPKTHKEFDRLTLTEPKEIVPPKNCDAILPLVGDADTLSEFRAKTKYGRYSRLGNTAIADSPLGKIYFAWDKKGNAIDTLDVREAATRDGKPVRVPQDCKVCHEKR